LLSKKKNFRPSGTATGNANNFYPMTSLHPAAKYFSSQPVLGSDGAPNLRVTEPTRGKLLAHDTSKSPHERGPYNQSCRSFLFYFIIPVGRPSGRCAAGPLASLQRPAITGARPQKPVRLIGRQLRGTLPGIQSLPPPLHPSLPTSNPCGGTPF
jgi:hypothetical protein